MKLKFSTKRTTAVVGLVLGLMAGSAQATTTTFFGRNASNQADASCTPLGGGGTTMCTSFYNSILDITILNNWNIGPSSDFSSAQALAAATGLAATGLSGWVLPTGDGGIDPSSSQAGLNQYLSIFLQAGEIDGLPLQFFGVQPNVDGNGPAYWSQSLIPVESSPGAWVFFSDGVADAYARDTSGLYAVAVRPGDVSDVPLPGTVALLGLGLVGIGAARRKQA